MQMPSSVRALRRPPPAATGTRPRRSDLVHGRAERAVARAGPARRPRRSTAGSPLSTASAPDVAERLRSRCPGCRSRSRRRRWSSALTAMPFVLGTSFTRGSRATAMRQRAGRGLEQRLRDVVRVAAAEGVEVDVQPAVVGQRPRRSPRTARWAWSPTCAGLERHAEVQAGPAGEVDHAARERLVQRHVGVAEAHDARACRRAPRSSACAERDADVLHACGARPRAGRPCSARRGRSGACVARAVSMWSRKPMPVAISRAALAVQVEGERGCRSRASCAPRAPVARARRGALRTSDPRRSSPPAPPPPQRGLAAAPRRARPGTPRSPPRVPTLTRRQRASRG